MGRYAVLEELALADCALEIEGASLDDLFETAARAVAELMVDPDTLATTVERTVHLTAPELDLLLYDWLSELIFLKDRDGAIFPRAQVSVTGSSPCELEGRLQGGLIDRAQTALRADAKAVTFHRFALERLDHAWRATVVIDI